MDNVLECFVGGNMKASCTTTTYKSFVPRPCNFIIVYTRVQLQTIWDVFHISSHPPHLILEHWNGLDITLVGHEKRVAKTEEKDLETICNPPHWSSVILITIQYHLHLCQLFFPSLFLSNYFHEHRMLPKWLITWISTVCC